MQSNATQKERSRLVIIGGGYGGITAAQAVDKDFNVTLIEKQERFFHNPAALRAAVDRDWVRKVFIPYDGLLQFGKTLRGTANHIHPSDKLIELQDGATVHYDYLILATGSRYPFPAKMAAEDVQNASEAIYQVNNEIEKASRILLLGAGPVGIEFAAELATKHSNKEITLLDPSPTLLSGYNPTLGRRLLSGLKDLRVKVILGERLAAAPEAAPNQTQAQVQTYRTDKGTAIEADLYFVCYGLQLNTEFLTTIFGDSMDDRGQIKVNRYLQVEGYQDIFAIGEIVNTGESKLAAIAGMHAGAATDNIRRLVKGQPLRPYKPMTRRLLIVPLGRQGGAAQLPLSKQGLILGAWAASFIKGRDLMVSRSWKNLGATLPE